MLESEISESDGQTASDSSRVCIIPIQLMCINLVEYMDNLIAFTRHVEIFLLYILFSDYPTIIMRDFSSAILHCTAACAFCWERRKLLLMCGSVGVVRRVGRERARYTEKHVCGP